MKKDWDDFWWNVRIDLWPTIRTVLLVAFGFALVSISRWLIR